MSLLGGLRCCRMFDKADHYITSLLGSIKVLRFKSEIPLDAMSYLTGIDISRLQAIEESRIVPSLEELQAILSELNCHIGILSNASSTIPVCLQEKCPNKQSTILIVGNGFDRALGMRTLYWDFVNSSFWPFDGEQVVRQETNDRYVSPLTGYLDNEVRIKGKYSIEDVIRDYCRECYDGQKQSGARYVSAVEDRRAFELLSQSFQSFIKREQDLFLANKEKLAKARQTTAGQLLLRLLHSNEEVFVHSFNYTDIELIAYHLDIVDADEVSFEEWSHRAGCWCHQMHSIVYGPRVVLGVEEDCPMLEEQSFFRKVNSTGFISSNILRDLHDADSVIFFGHSIAKIDQCYFHDFFVEQSKSSLPREQSKTITIYTLNSESGNAILTNLEGMEGVNVLNLRSNNDFSIEYTS